MEKCPLSDGKQHWEFENTPIDAIREIVDGNTYLSELHVSADLQLLLPEKIREAWSQTNEKGMFNIFSPKESQHQPIYHWSRTKLERRGNSFSLIDFEAYIGLVLVLSVVRIVTLKEFRESKMISEHPYLKESCLWSGSRILELQSYSDLQPLRRKEAGIAFGWSEVCSPHFRKGFLRFLFHSELLHLMRTQYERKLG